MPQLVLSERCQARNGERNSPTRLPVSPTAPPINRILEVRSPVPSAVLRVACLPAVAECCAPAPNMKLTLLHVFAVVHFFYGIYYGLAYVTFPKGVMPDVLLDIGWKKFLTFWNMCLQALYFTVAVLNDIAGSNEIAPKNTPLIRKIKDYLLCTVAFPVAMFVGLTFWGLYAIDRELVFPKALDPYFPTWLNHVMHTNIMIFIVLEMVLTFRKYPTRGNGMGGLTAFMVVYLVWTFIIYFYSGAWVYPVLEVLNWGQRAVFFIGLLFFVNSLYFMGEFLNKTVWVKELKQVHSSGSSKRKKQKD